MPFKSSMTLAERIDSKTIKDDPSGCWLWSGSMRHGYAQIQTGTYRRNRPRKVASINFERFKGIIPEGCGMVVRHSCDNPGCINPTHLFIGTSKDNVTDMINRGRARLGGSSFNLEQVKQIRALRNSGGTFGKIAKQFSMSKANVFKICHATVWMGNIL